MSRHIQEQIEQGKARIVAEPKADLPRHQVEADRNFELPTALYGATVGLFLSFLGVMFIGLATPGLIIPMAIFAIFIVGMFGFPAAWTRLKGNESEPMTMGKFANEGIMTYTGRLAPRDAAIQMLILPVLVVLWAIAVVTIVAIVS